MRHLSVRHLQTLLLTLLAVGLFTVHASAKESDRSKHLTMHINNTFGWNFSDVEEPLLLLPEKLRSEVELTLTLPFGQFGMPVSQSLHYNAQSHRYLLMLVSDNGRRGRFLELRQTGSSHLYVSDQTPDVELEDRGGIKLLHAQNGTQYSFVADEDSYFRCIQIRNRTGSLIRLTYNSEGLLKELSDNAGRSISVSYANDRVAGIVQTWSVAAVKMVKSWNSPAPERVEFSSTAFENGGRFGSVKAIPTNALMPNYTGKMAACDQLLARIFGGPGAIAAANSYEPPGLSGHYPIYRGDLLGKDGRLRRGHLSFAMHLYGNEDGTGSTALYVPSGFTSHSLIPTPTDAAITFYYPRLGNLTDITIAVFHVADFSIRAENGRIRIGNIGGRGGSFQLYKHSHIEFYSGNTGLPASDRRQSMRINPSLVFSVSDDVRFRTVAQQY